MENDEIEMHPFEPFIPTGGKVLMLGSFPPGKARWTMDFFYPNWINDMWRIMGIIFYGDKDYFCNVSDKTFKLSEIKEFLTTHHIALYDTASAIVRLKGNAADKYLDIRKTINLGAILASHPVIETIITTGQKAADVIAEITSSKTPKIGDPETFIFEGHKITHYWMPSTSRAYPMKIDEKAKYYSSAFQALGYDLFKKNL